MFSSKKVVVGLFILASLGISPQSLAKSSPRKIDRMSLYASMSFLNYRNGKIKKISEEKRKELIKRWEVKEIIDLNDLDGALVEIQAYAKPMSADKKVTEMMLVGDEMYCQHVEPPPPNQLIHVKIKDKKNAVKFEDFADITPFKVIGRLSVHRKKSEYYSAGFTLVADSVKKTAEGKQDPYLVSPADQEGMQKKSN